MPNESTSLRINIEYKEYISLSEFKESIEGWNNQYNFYISQKPADEKNDTLLIKEIKQGSIIIELILALMPLVADFNNIFTFYMAIKSLFTWLGTKKGQKLKISVGDLDNTKK
jgi:hypothetical protein